MYRCESWAIRKAVRQRIDAFELWCWRRLLRVPWTARRSNPVSPKGNQSWIFIGRTDAEAETPILWPPDAKNWLTWKDLDVGKDWRQEEKGKIENKVVGGYYQLNGHEFEQAPGDGEGQGGLTCYSPWSCRVGHDWATEEQLFNYSTTFSYIWNYPVSKGLKSIFILDAFPSYELTKHQAKILSFSSLSHLFRRRKKHEVVRLSQDPFSVQKLWRKDCNQRLYLPKLKLTNSDVQRLLRHFLFSIKCGFWVKALCLMNTLLYKAYGLQV